VIRFRPVIEDEASVTAIDREMFLSFASTQ